MSFGEVWSLVAYALWWSMPFCWVCPLVEYALWWICPLLKHTLWWFMPFGGICLSVEYALWLNMPFGEYMPFGGYVLWWNMPFGGICPFVEYVLWWSMYAIWWSIPLVEYALWWSRPYLSMPFRKVCSYWIALRKKTLQLPKGIGEHLRYLISPKSVNKCVQYWSKFLYSCKQSITVTDTFVTKVNLARQILLKENLIENLMNIG